MKNLKIEVNFRLKRLLLIGALAPVVFAGQAMAATTGTVAATVTPQNISVSVSDGSVAYGIVDLSTTRDTTSGGVNDTQVATNDGNVAEDFNIRSTDATGGTGWTLAGSIDADQFVHSFCTTGGGSPDPCDATPTWNAMSTSYSSLAGSVAVSSTRAFDLKLDTPSSTSDYLQKSITVTIQAVID